MVACFRTLLLSCWLAQLCDDVEFVLAVKQCVCSRTKDVCVLDASVSHGAVMIYIVDTLVVIDVVDIWQYSVSHWAVMIYIVDTLVVVDVVNIRRLMPFSCCCNTLSVVASVVVCADVQGLCLLCLTLSLCFANVVVVSLALMLKLCRYVAYAFPV